MATNTLERTRRDLRWVPVGELKPYRGNARRHSKKQIQAIARSIERFGFTAPVLVDESNRLLAGHGRVAAAKLIGLDTVPTVRIDHLNDDEKRAYVIADNRLAERAGWDKETLAIELEALTELAFPVELTGFEVPEVDIIIAEHGSERRAVAGSHRNNVELGRHGRNRRLAGEARSAAGRHPARREIDPHYCDVALHRWQAFTGKEARHEGTGLGFAERGGDGGIR